MDPYNKYVLKIFCVLRRMCRFARCSYCRFYDCTKSVAILCHSVIISALYLCRFYFFIGAHNSLINIYIGWYSWMEIIIIFNWNPLKWIRIFIPLKVPKYKIYEILWRGRQSNNNKKTFVRENHKKNIKEENENSSERRKENGIEKVFF